MVGYHITYDGNPDAYPLHIAAKVLSDGQSSRIYQKLVYDKQIAVAAFGQANLIEDPNLFYAVAIVQPGQKTEDAASALIAEFDRLKSEPISEHELQVWIGGPVEPQSSWILDGHDSDVDDESRGVRLAENLYLSTSPDLLHRLLGPKPPSRTRLIVGYSGWGPGQLEAELEASAWLISDVDRDVLFGTPADRMWETAIRRLGADPAALQMSRGIH